MLRLQFVLVFAVAAVGCASTTPGSGDEGDGDPVCRSNEQLVDGVCQPVRDRDTGVQDTNGDPDAGQDLAEEPETSGPCTPNTATCRDAQTAVRCESGGIEVVTTCISPQTCENGACVDDDSCSPGAFQGCDDPNNVRICNDAGDGYDVEACGDDAPNCIASRDGCTEEVCIPRSTRCNPERPDDSELCNEAGSEWTFIETCSDGDECISGVCGSPCEENAKVASFLGCDYWALDLDNVDEDCDDEGGCRRGECNTSTNKCEPSAASQQFAVTVSNPNTDPVDVTIVNFATEAEQTVTVGAQDVRLIALDRLDVDGPTVNNNGYHITTTLPVTMHQFNPANNVGVFSNDASLLLPSNAGGLDYVVLGWPTGPFGSEDAGALGYAAVVAVGTAEATTVTVTSPVPIQGGDDFAEVPADTPTEFVLEYGQVLSLQTLATAGADLTGTRISAGQKILVFVGHECAFVPDDPVTPYCDHIEQQLFPVEAWGTSYFLAKLSPRGTEPDVFRVVAAENGTAITTNPMITGVHGRTMAAGEMFEFEATGGFSISGTKSIQVGQFMIGSAHEGVPASCQNPIAVPAPVVTCLAWAIGGGGLTCRTVGGVAYASCSTDEQCQGSITTNPPAICSTDGLCSVGTGIGDPAYMLAVPVAQFRDNYAFFTPADYREDWVTAIVPDDATLTMDGTEVSTDGYVPIADGYSLVHISTSNTGGADPARVHTITGTAPFGLQVYGYDCNVSYAYPGGLNLEVEE